MVFRTKVSSGLATGLSLNPAKPLTMHLDINSCFATLEQQANPLLRGVPLVVAAYNQPFGCILASSVEAKLWGVKTGMSVQEGRELCPLLVIREADPDKYRFIHASLRRLLDCYSAQVFPKSIDEFVLDLSHTPSRSTPLSLAREIKSRIRQEIGEWITVSIGVAPNRFLAKLGADIDKPNGYQLITQDNLVAIYRRISLTDFCGIHHRLAKRLKEQGIFTPLDFLKANLTTLRGAFRSVVARDWYLRVRGYEVDNVEFTRKSFGQSYVLPRPTPEAEWLPVLAKLVDKATRRLRTNGYGARGVHLFLGLGPAGSWSHGHQGSTALFTTPDLLALTHSVYRQCQFRGPVKQIAVSFFALEPLAALQLSLLTDRTRDRHLSSLIDQVNERYGPYTLSSASMLGTERFVRDAIAFGK